MNKKELYTVPNLFTSLRVIILIIMWVLFFQRSARIIIGILFGVSWLTDFFDGYFARKLKQETKFGAKFDSIADNATILSIMIWLPFLLPDMIKENLVILIVSVSLVILSWIIATIKFKRNPAFHLISNKAGMVVVGLFIVHALVFEYSKVFLYIASILFIFMALEEIAITLTHDDINENIKSFFSSKGKWQRKRMKKEKRKRMQK